MNKPIVINFFGGPGAGKSTHSSGLFYELKKDMINCEYVCEYAKDLTWEERNKTLENQIYVFAKQHHRMWRIKDSVDVIVTDSPLLLSVIYGEHNTESFHNLVLDVTNRFLNFNYFIEHSKDYIPIGRNQSENQAKQIDNKILNYLIDTEQTFEYLRRDYDENINYVKTRILQLLKPVIKKEFMNG
jgi:tRNA uridine 5-carbamoylmethylation protein Kti12